MKYETVGRVLFIILMPILIQFACAAHQISEEEVSMKPEIVKLGTIDCDLVETTPIVFKGRLYRFEYVRERYKGNELGVSYFRFVDHETGEKSKPFAKDYHLGNVFVEDDTLYVTGTNIWAGEIVELFVSTDMENWETRNVLNLPGYEIFNTSMCKADDRYVLMFEIGAPPEVAGVAFTARFAVSKNLVNWELTPDECNFLKQRYTAPHCLRYLDGYFYNFYVEAFYEENRHYDQYVARSKDLIHWEFSPYNPVLEFSDDDKKIANPNLTDQQRRHIDESVNINNSDIDFCEHQGRLIINYSWGNQQGLEFLAEAYFDGTQEQFLKGWFE